MQITYAQRILQAHEQERAWIAGELHDDALQRVAMIRHELDGLWTSVAPAAGPGERHRLRALNAELLDLGVLLRNIAQRLHPSLLDHIGLQAALQALAAEVGRALGLEVTLKVPEGELTVPKIVAHAAYRIAQEALRNAAAHAGTGAATLELVRANGDLVIRVSDAGRGFVQEEADARQGLGLLAMQERAGYVGGRLRVDSTPGAGTTVEATLPLEHP